MAVFDKTPGTNNDTVESERTWCKTCGGHVYTGHPAIGLVDVPAVVIQDFDFKPGFHVHYQESVHHMQDGLPKFKDLPTQAGGSGKEMSE
jgi:hypothetical protein